MNPAFWRRWHRWIGAVATLFLLFASITGVLLAVTEFFGEAEALREATRHMVSPVRTSDAAPAWSDAVTRALATAASEAPGAPVDRVVVQFKGDRPTVDVYLGRPAGGEDRRLVMDAGSGALLRVDTYADKPLLNRIHSGEFFGDGGLVVAIVWGTALVALSLSGLAIYLSMRRRNRTGLQRVFW
jgi:uncharacterized iron-regulated membrane protein